MYDISADLYVAILKMTKDDTVHKEKDGDENASRH